MSLKRMFGWRRLARRMELYRERTRRFPLPRYTTGTPRVENGALRLHLPPTAATLAHGALSGEAIKSVACVLERLTPCDDLALKLLLYRWGLERFAAHWRYADLFTTLWAAATFLQPDNYLEVGVRRGWSAAVVGSASPDCAIYGFDIWQQDYHGLPNPGPEFVRSELRAAGHRGSVTLISGDSYATLAAFLRQHRGLYFDLITIDGDKSVRGHASDMTNALPRLKVGGIIVCDDLALAPALRRVWQKVIEVDGRYVSWEFRDAGSCVSAAIRVSDDAPLSMVPAL